MLRLRPVLLTSAFLTILVVLPAVSTEAARLGSARPVTVISASGPACDVPAPTRCYNPCIIYRHRRPCRKVCCRSESPVKSALVVQDPRACGGLVEIPVCLPACCEGAPCVKSRCGLFDKGVVTYRWCCGYKVVVAFKKHGDIVVTSFGT